MITLTFTPTQFALLLWALRTFAEDMDHEGVFELFEEIEREGKVT